MKIEELQSEINTVFKECFGRTPLRLRLEDILGEAIELSRFTDLNNLKEEAGDLLCSLLQLFNENGWNVNRRINLTLQKIKNRKDQYKTLGRKIKVAILGGAFDPIHQGHIQVAKAVLDWSKTFDEVWLMPCYKHLYGKQLTDSRHRLKMCELASQQDGRIKVFDYEIKHKLQGETYHLVTRLLDEDFAKDQYDFSLIIGLDNANDFDKWVNYKHLERSIRFVVVPRSGINRDEAVDWYLKSPHIYLSNVSIPDYSSTQVREYLKEGIYQHLSEVLDSLVVKYIKDNELYKKGD